MYWRLIFSGFRKLEDFEESKKKNSRRKPVKSVHLDLCLEPGGIVEKVAIILHKNLI